MNFRSSSSSPSPRRSANRIRATTSQLPRCLFILLCISPAIAFLNPHHGESIVGTLDLPRPSKATKTSSKQLCLQGEKTQRSFHHHSFISSQTKAAFATTTTATDTTSTRLQVHRTRDADFYEELIGGQRYEMVPLPDSMLDTTLFVGNLNEFVHDEDLSALFCRVSSLQSLPACVARRPNTASLEYGFVTFPTAEEKQKALMRFHGYNLMGRNIKVEEIRDHPKKGRVRVPENLVSYVIGEVKKTRDGKANDMRRIRRLEQNNKGDHKNSNSKNTTPRNSSAKKKNGNKKKSAKLSRNKLTDLEEQEMQRALKRGYLTLEGTGYRRGRKTSALACAHREWCDEHRQPQIVLCKASGGRPLDCIVVDLSPLRMHPDLVNMPDHDFLLYRKTQILTAAANADMALRSDYLEDNCESLWNPAYEGIEDEDDDDDDGYDDYAGYDENCIDSAGDEYEGDSLEELCSILDEATECIVLMSDDGEHIECDHLVTDDDDETRGKAKRKAAKKLQRLTMAPISELPSQSLGVFEGERTNAKAMAKELALLWGIPDSYIQAQEEASSSAPPSPPDDFDSSSPNGGYKEDDTHPYKRRNSKQKKEDHRRRRRRQARELDFYSF